MAAPEHDAATRRVYDFSAGHYASVVGTTISAAFERPIDRAALDAFAEDVATEGQGPVVDIGCGVGRVAQYLHVRGLDVRGLDLSPEMIAVARSAHPHLSFDVAALTDLPVGDGSLAGAVLWYSIIHSPP